MHFTKMITCFPPSMSEPPSLKGTPAFTTSVKATSPSIYITVLPVSILQVVAIKRHTYDDLIEKILMFILLF